MTNTTSTRHPVFTFFYTDNCERQALAPVADEMANRGYPVQWSTDSKQYAEVGVYCEHACKPNAGFSNASAEELWLPINENDLPLAVNRQRQDPKSFFSLYKAAMRLRKELPSIRDGKYSPLEKDNEDIIAYGRNSEEQHAVVLVNCTTETQTVTVEAPFSDGEIVISSIDVVEGLGRVSLQDSVTLRPDEAIVIVEKS